ncbi:MAG TPA: ABC transporter ATP-binding protein [Ktedonobacterales bacterium]|nr:ABC transporter ATP-binding protein [Ktedonobacterales bacterium]
MSLFDKLSAKPPFGRRDPVVAPESARTATLPTLPHRRAPSRKVLLEVRDVTVKYGQIAAVRNLSLRVGEGQVVALLGANGAGKTTTLRMISGLLRPRSGEVRFDEQRIDRWSAERIARAGIAHLPEGRGIFPHLSVGENLHMAGYGVGVEGSVYAERLERALSVFPVLGERLGQLAGTLSGGQQQMLAVGRSLITNPRLLMIDELSFGLAPGVVKQLFLMLPAITASGTSILLVEQFVGQALAVADFAYVLEKGEVTFAGPAHELARQEGFVESSYLGSGAMRLEYDRVRPAETEMLRVRVDPALVRQLRVLANGRPLAEIASEALRAHVVATNDMDRGESDASGASGQDIANIPTLPHGWGDGVMDSSTGGNP